MGGQFVDHASPVSRRFAIVLGPRVLLQIAQLFIAAVQAQFPQPQSALGGIQLCLLIGQEGHSLDQTQHGLQRRTQRWVHFLPQSIQIQGPALLNVRRNPLKDSPLVNLGQILACQWLHAQAQ